MSYTNFNHRDGFATCCPFCSFQQNNDDWIIQAKEVIDSTPAHEDGVVAMTQCPGCGESSWAHFLKSTLVRLGIIMEASL